jgi:hypothetical protein
MSNAADEFDAWLRQRVAAIRAGRAAYGIADGIPGASPDQVDQLAAAALREFGVALPAAYLQFLTVQNGGGEHASLYGTQAIDEPMRSVTSFIEANRDLRGDDADRAEFLVYGETDLD